MKTLSLCTALLAATAAVPAVAVTVVNGDFEGGANGLGNPNGWTVAPGAEIRVNNGFDYQPCCGTTGSDLANHFASFGSGDQANVSTLSQTLNTVAGQRYILRFDAGALGGGSQTLTANAYDGATLLGTLSAVRPANNNLDATYGAYSFAFIAGGGPTTISFNVDPFTSSVDGILDNVSLAVPEPAQWALMIGGFAIAGGALRRRRGAPAVAA